MYHIGMYYYVHRHFGSIDMTRMLFLTTVQLYFQIVRMWRDGAAILILWWVTCARAVEDQNGGSCSGVGGGAAEQRCLDDDLADEKSKALIRLNN